MCFLKKLAHSLKLEVKLSAFKNCFLLLKTQLERIHNYESLQNR